jgi:hypothetical protein
VKVLSRFDPSWILVVVLAVFAVAPLTYPGFFEAHSGFLPAFNVEHLSAAPNWGRLADPVRGAGKLPYLLVWPFYALSGSGITAIKWGYGLAFLLGALGVHAWARRWLGTKGGILAATLYTYLPWHLGTVYVRGAYAEAWLWAFWPFTLWSLDRLGEGRTRATLTALAVGLPVLAATFWTLPGLAALALLLLLAYGAVLSIRHPRPLLRLAGMLALSILLLWFASGRMPAATVSFSEQFLYPFQLLSAAWGDQLSFQLGLAAVGLSIVAVALAAIGSTERRDKGSAPFFPSPLHRRALWFWTGALLVLVLLTLPLSDWLWRTTGLDAYLAYPWQLLALAGLPLVFLAGSVTRLDERLATLPAWAGLLALTVLASYPYLAPPFTQVDPGPEPVALIEPVAADAPQIMLLDYDLVAPTEITPTLTLTLTWQAVAPIADDYTVFVHLLGPDGSKAAQRDARPCDGQCPTNTWQPGEIILDHYQLALDPGAAPGPYRLAVGLYLLGTGDRATVVGRDDKTVVLDVP